MIMNNNVLWQTKRRRMVGGGFGDLGFSGDLEYRLFSHSSPLLSSILPSQRYFANKNG